MCSVGSDGKKSHRVRLHFGLWCALAAMILGLGVTRAPAQCLEQQKLTASDAAENDRFGSVSASGDIVVVGAFEDNSVYVFRFNGTSWVEEQKLTASGPSGRFGSSVFTSGDAVIVGSSGNGCAAGGDCGSAYVFRSNGNSYAEEQELTPSDAAADVHFGNSVSVSGDVALVGAFRDDCAAGVDCGSAYVFRFTGERWVEEQKLTASDAAPVDLFGNSVSVSGNTAVVGAFLDGCAPGIGQCGSAYVYRFNGISWDQQAKLTAHDAAIFDHFGVSVALSGTWIVVGASGVDCSAGDNCGAAYVYRFDVTSWVEQQKLTAFEASASDSFGTSVSLDGNTAVIGANGNNCTAGADCGSAYVFRLNEIASVGGVKLTASDAGLGDFLGRSVSVSGDTAVAGANADDCPGSGSDCGSAYIFDLNEPCCGDGMLDPGEECDRGIACTDCLCNSGFEPTVPPSADCQPICGNGIIVPSEECDGGLGCTNCLCDAGFEPTIPPSLDCQPICGNGSFDPDEECDAGLGCTECLCDTEFELTTPPSLDCRAICGNGNFDLGEECDGGLACTDCFCESGFEPTDPPFLDCQPICGNGNLNPDEECDGGLDCIDCSCDSGFQSTVPPSFDCQPKCGDGNLYPG